MSSFQEPLFSGFYVKHRSLPLYCTFENNFLFPKFILEAQCLGGTECLILRGRGESVVKMGMRTILLRNNIRQVLFEQSGSKAFTFRSYMLEYNTKKPF
jgi:hypothetical protein